jgi:hypothetical protein
MSKPCSGGAFDHDCNLLKPGCPRILLDKQRFEHLLEPLAKLFVFPGQFRWIAASFKWPVKTSAHAVRHYRKIEQETRFIV